MAVTHVIQEGLWIKSLIVLLHVHLPFPSSYTWTILVPYHYLLRHVTTSTPSTLTCIIISSTSTSSEGHSCSNGFPLTRIQLTYSQRPFHARLLKSTYLAFNWSLADGMCWTIRYGQRAWYQSQRISLQGLVWSFHFLSFLIASCHLQAPYIRWLLLLLASRIHDT